MRFLYKFTLLLSILIILSSIIQFLVFDKIFISDTDSLLLNINEKAAENVSVQLLENFRKIEKSLKLIAADEKIRENKDLIDKFNNIIPEVDVITILNSRGDIVLLSGNKYDPRVLNLSQRDYFGQAIQGKTYISDVFTTYNGSKAVAISVPIIKNNRVDGVVVGTVKLQGDSLTTMFDNKEFGRKGYITILDRQGNVVYHPYRDRIGEKAVYLDELKEQTGAKIMKDYSGEDRYIGYNKVTDIDWIVVVNTPTNDIIKNRNIMIGEILLLSLLGIVAIVLMGTYTVRRYTEPLDQLIHAFNTLKSGNFKKIDLHGYKEEFHEMIRVYNNTIEKLQEIQIDLKEAADIDSLTGAYNRRAFDNLLMVVKEEVISCKLKSLGVFLLDVDYFKNLNDTAGHLAGDAILKKLTGIMKHIAGDRAVFRFGGDEFVIILRNIPDESLLNIAERIRSESEKALSGCTVSIGLASFPKDTDSVEQLVDLADKALYISKESKNKVTEYAQI